MIEQNLLLERELTQLTEQKRTLISGIDILKNEQLALLDLKDRLQTEISSLNEKKKKALKEIEADKDKWERFKGEEKLKLDEDRIEVDKILNRESYIKVQEAKLREKELLIAKRDVESSVKEADLSDRESQLEKRKIEADKYVEECSKKGAEIKGNLGKLKEEIISQVNNW